MFSRVLPASFYGGFTRDGAEVGGIDDLRQCAWGRAREQRVSKASMMA